MFIFVFLNRLVISLTEGWWYVNVVHFLGVFVVALSGLWFFIFCCIFVLFIMCAA
jgi:hypothetical protein